jgi:hypothetical protein
VHVRATQREPAYCQSSYNDGPDGESAAGERTGCYRTQCGSADAPVVSEQFTAHRLLQRLDTIAESTAETPFWAV